MSKSLDKSCPVRVLILGASFAGRGAEAMILVVADAIRKHFSNPTLCVRIYNDQGIEACRSHGFYPVKSKQRGRIMRHLYPWMRDHNLAPSGPVDPRRPSPPRLLNPFRLADVVVDISGFASGDPWGRQAAIQRWKTSLDIRYAGAKIVYMPQSWGPFEDIELAGYTTRMLEDADLVFAREQQGYDALLKRCRIDSSLVHLMPDIAFQFKPAAVEEARRTMERCGILSGKGPIVGITPNIRIYERVEGEGPDNIYVKTLVAVIQQLCKKAGAQVLLIPHETWRGRPDDMQMCSMILQELGTCKSAVFALSGDNNAAETKAIIGQLDYLVASRYHSLVAALSMRVPVAVLGWAKKYDELMTRVDLSKWTFDPVHNPTGGEADALFEAWEMRDTIHSAIEHNVPRLEADSERSLSMMLDVITDSCSGRL